ncbi:echinoidin-like [Diadema antillarum]|uniref:echinoidin-like n=1 Tax=Diadema antillarum TaxID=105358 RepID=UPI003A869F97
MARALIILAGLLAAASLRVDAGSICPTYWTEFNGSCYRHFARQMTWWEAEIHCQTHVLPSASDCSTYTMAHLASVTTQAEQEFLYTFFNTNADVDSESTSGVRLWIGINDIVVEGEFVWSDGSNASYRNWRPNQPDNYRGQEDCVHIGLTHVRRNEWNDINCNSDTIRHFICKGPARILDP